MTIDWLYQGGELTSFSVIGNDVVLYPELLSAVEADQYFRTFRKDIHWQKETVLMYGREVEVPRLVAWYGDSGKQYRYSNVDHVAEPWTSSLLDLKLKVENIVSADFNSVLLNLYRDGNDSVAWHSDDEPELGKEPVIASVSLGAERVFQFRRKDNAAEKLEVNLPHGSLLLMSGCSQSEWVHQVPKRRHVVEPRINLTFRRIKS